MTLALSVPTVSYLGGGNANVFPFNFLVFLQTHLSVTVNAVAPSTTIYTLILGIDYTVQGLSPSGEPAQSGTITLVNSGQAWLTGGNLTNGWPITIQRVVPLTQNTSIRNQGDFFRETLEDSLDYVTMMAQQIQQQLNTVQAQVGVPQAGKLNSFSMIDANGKTWTFTVDTNGRLGSQ